ncbi:MAG: hypothetical protein L0Z62_00795 [Gemmataceae bacterium]|nr:hypothetical protein [Gemmataceae bacterium]
MKWWSGAGVLGAWVLVMSAGGTGGASGPKADPWLIDPAAARAASRASGKPILALIH